MNDERLVRLLQRGGTATVFVAAMAASNLSFNANFSMRLLLAASGVGLAAGAAALWGERTRPKSTGPWVLFGLAALVWVVFGFFGNPANSPYLTPILPLSLIVGLLLAHDLGLGPTFMLTASVIAALAQPTLRWRSAPDATAWWVGTTVLLGVIAATLERERLLPRDNVPTPWPWTLVRIGVVTLWTAGVLATKEQLQVGNLFAGLGADPRGFEGQLTLLAIILVSLVIAIFVFRAPRPKVPPIPPPPGGARNP